MMDSNNLSMFTVPNRSTYTGTPSGVFAVYHPP